MNVCSQAKVGDSGYVNPFGLAALAESGKGRCHVIFYPNPVHHDLVCLQFAHQTTRQTNPFQIRTREQTHTKPRRYLF